MTASPGPHRGTDAGFTLVEALVSLLIFSVIAAGSTALLIQAARAQRQVAEAQEVLRGMQMTRAALTSDLMQLAPRTPRAIEEGLAPRFVGGDEAVALGFVRSAVVREAAVGVTNALVYVHYEIKGGQLIRRTSRQLAVAGAGAEAEGGQVLLDHAEALHFEFYDGATWHRQWIAAETGLPRAVALVAELPRYGPVRLEVLTTQDLP